MHIPDGYLSPLTYGVGLAVSVPLIVKSFRRLQDVANTEGIARLSALTALSFLMMMLNIPLPGGTSGHALGTALLTLSFGPWVGALCVALVLFIQALFFGDGGLTTLGWNIINMGYWAAFWTWLVNKWLGGKYPRVTPFLAGWMSIVVAAGATALVLGIQPYLAHDAQGQPLFFPFSLNVTLPAMILPHILLFGVVEGLFTLGMLRLLEKYEILPAKKV